MCPPNTGVEGLLPRCWCCREAADILGSWATMKEVYLLRHVPGDAVILSLLPCSSASYFLFNFHEWNRFPPRPASHQRPERKQPSGRGQTSWVRINLPPLRWCSKWFCHSAWNSTIHRLGITLLKFYFEVIVDAYAIAINCTRNLLFPCSLVGISCKIQNNTKTSILTLADSKRGDHCHHHKNPHVANLEPYLLCSFLSITLNTWKSKVCFLFLWLCHYYMNRLTY